jgi:glyoxylase-like metal-dependent hydrolase (beta-lactamase superfamily II)
VTPEVQLEPLSHGGWVVDLLDCGAIELPGEALGPDFGESVMTPVLATLWRGHGRTALVDAGAGVCDALWPGGAGLPVALERTGVAPGEITDIVLTHLDFDHAGGVVAGTWPEQLSPAFPSAAVRVADFGLDWWWNAEERPLTVGPRILRALRAAGALETFSDGADVLPGVRARSAPGHCAGHTVLEVAGGEGVLLHLADAIHHRSHVEHPEWDHLYDRKAEIALATRTALLAEAEERGAVLLASHIDAPGLIERVGGKPIWNDRAA